MNTKSNANIPDYTSYPKLFSPYKWYKPLLTILIGAAVWFLLGSPFTFLTTATLEAIKNGTSVAAAAKGGYDGFDAYSVLGALANFGAIAMFLPAILIANRIVNARPFSSYSSSRGGFNWAAFFKSLGISVVLYVIPLAAFTLFTEPNTGNIRFTVFGFIVCTILCPLQCVGEEYLHRGFLMQTFGSWFKFPVIAIILQSVVFAAMHPYNWIGVANVFTIGIILGLCAYFTKGLEGSCALHIVNNMTTFYLSGFGIGAVHTEQSIAEWSIPSCLALLFLGFMIFASKKLGWFSKVKKDDVALFNEKIKNRKQKKA